jgi:hypothetical protein
VWQLIKTEIKYNSDFIYFITWGVFLFGIVQYYYAGVLDRTIDVSAILLLQGGLFFPFIVGLRRRIEKRDRLLVLLPVSIRQLGLARFLLFGFYLVALFVTVSLLNWWSLILFPHIVSSFTAHLSILGIIAIYTAVFYFLVPDSRGYINKTGTLLNIPLHWILNVFKLFLAFGGIICYFLVLGAIQNFTMAYTPGIFYQIFGDLGHRMLKSGTWTMGFIFLGLFLCALAVWVFEKRRSYTG